LTLVAASDVFIKAKSIEMSRYIAFYSNARRVRYGRGDKLLMNSNELAE
jgi:hypothetical protein